jgi:hypothetical protein
VTTDLLASDMHDYGRARFHLRDDQCVNTSVPVAFTPVMVRGAALAHASEEGVMTPSASPSQSSD